jgi:hypothetical protein
MYKLLGKIFIEVKMNMVRCRIAFLKSIMRFLKEKYHL